MPKSRILTITLSLMVSGVCLYFAFRDISWSAFFEELKHFEWSLFGLGLLLAVAHNFLGALRWWIVLRESGKISFFEAFLNLRVAYFCNATLPGKVGEGVRIYLIKKRTKISAAHAIGAMAGDRLSELIGLLAFIYLSGAVLGFRKEFFFGKIILGVSLAVILAVLILRFLPKESEGRMKAVWEFLHRVKAGLKPLSQPRLFSLLLIVSLLGWACHGGILVLFSYGVDTPISFYKAILVTAAVTFAVSVPSAPGNFGPFELAAIYTLHSVLGLPYEKAVSITLLYHIVQLLPTYAFGLLGVTILGVRKKELSKLPEGS